MTTLNVSELAVRLDTDARTTRKFLRSVTPIDAQPGKGSRWAVEAKQVVSLKSKFTKFVAANESARLDREAASAADRDVTPTLEIAESVFILADDFGNDEVDDDYEMTETD